MSYITHNAPQRWREATEIFLYQRILRHRQKFVQSGRFNENEMYAYYQKETGDFSV